MQPTEHMNPAEDELIAHIRERLSGHEEDYVPGAWENFNKKERKRPVIWLWSFSSAAAVLILCALLFLREEKNLPELISKNGSSTQRVTDNNEYRAAKPINNSVSSNNPVVVGQQKIKASGTNAVNQVNIIPIEDPTLASKPDALAIRTDLEPNIQDPPRSMPSKDATQTAIVKTIPDHKKISIEDFLAKESERNAVSQDVKKKKADKWEMGLMVAPSMGNNKKLNMGYGLSMAYVLSDKVSLGSGLTYNEMGAARDNTSLASAAPNAPSTIALASSTKQLQSVQTRLRGVDVPLEFRYKFSPKLYANAGVSVFAVFKQEQQNTFLQSSVEQASAVGLLNEDKEAFRQVLVNRIVSEEAPKDEVRNDPYLGFYNFSIGFRQKVSKKSAIAVEPFLKVPMKQATNENLNLIGTGVKLRFDF